MVPSGQYIKCQQIVAIRQSGIDVLLSAGRQLIAPGQFQIYPVQAVDHGVVNVKYNVESQTAEDDERHYDHQYAAGLRDVRISQAIRYIEKSSIAKC